MSATAFDAAAASYDREFTDTTIGHFQRETVWRFLDDRILAGAPKSVVDLGCGTGEDAVRFASRGHRVTATDASATMVAVAEAKIGAAGRTPIRCRVLDLRDVGDSLPGGPFDLAFSNFGALNCLSPAELERFARGLAGVLVPGGRAILVLISSFCLWETLWLGLHGHFREARRRRSRDAVSARVGEGAIPIWYHRRRRLTRAFRPWFAVREVRPVGAAVPPSYLQGLFDDRPRLLGALATVDRALERFPVFARASDHVLYDLERVSAPEGDRRRDPGDPT